jgi:hypothetical protein
MLLLTSAFNFNLRRYTKVCNTHVDEIKQKFPEAEEDHFQYLCLDVAYAYALLTDGFGLEAGAYISPLSSST